MKKTALIALLLAATMMMSGCSLIVKDAKVDAKRIVADVNGETMNKETFLKQYNDSLNYQYQMQQMYKQFGMQAPAVNPDEVMQTTMDSVVRTMVTKQKAAELKLNALSDAEKEKVVADAAKDYESYLEQIKGQYFADTKLEGEELNRALEEKATELGLLKSNIEISLTEQAIQDNLRKDTVKDVTVSGEDIQKEYDSRVEKDKERFTKDLNVYGTAVNGTQTVYYAPEGYRYIKQVLIKFTADDQKLIDEAKAAATPLAQAETDAQTAMNTNEEALKKEGISEADQKALKDQQPALQKTLEEAQKANAEAQKKVADLTETAYLNIEAKAKEVYEKAKAEGADFDALVAEFNEDKGMPASGYAVCENFNSFDVAFVKPAMALQNPGDVAEPSKGIYGFYIVQYAAPIASGNVPLETVKDTIQNDLLTQKQNTVYEEAVAAWTKAADVKTFMDRLKD